jgi:hypothetical protein
MNNVPRLIETVTTVWANKVEGCLRSRGRGIVAEVCRKGRRVAPVTHNMAAALMPVCTVHRARIGSFVTSRVFDRPNSKLNLLGETPRRYRIVLGDRDQHQC